MDSEEGPGSTPLTLAVTNSPSEEGELSHDDNDEEPCLTPMDSTTIHTTPEEELDVLLGELLTSSDEEGLDKYRPPSPKRFIRNRNRKKRNKLGSTINTHGNMGMGSTSGNLDTHPYPHHHHLASILLRTTQCKTIDQFIKEPLSTQVSQLFVVLSPTPETIGVIDRLICDLQTIIGSKFPSYKLHQFGLSLTHPDGGCAPDSNSTVELFVEIPNDDLTDNCPEPNQVRYIVNNVIDLLRLRDRGRKEGFRYTKIKAARTRRFLRVHFIAMESIHVRVTFDSILPVYRDQLVLFYINLHHLIKPLLKLVHLWANCNGFFKTTRVNITDSCLTWMVLVYAGYEEIVPSLAKMMGLVENKQNNGKVEGWDVTYSKDHSTILSAFPPSIISSEDVDPDLLMDLLKGFFDFYAKFDPQKEIICTNAFEIVSKDCFIGNKTPDLKLGDMVYASWLRNRQRDPLITFQSKTFFWMQDPFALHINIGAFDRKGELILQFQQACRESSKILESGATNTKLLDILPVPPISAAPMLTFNCKRPNVQAKNVVPTVHSKIVQKDFIFLEMELERIVKEIYSNVTDSSTTTIDLDNTFLAGLRVRPESQFIRQFALSMDELDVVRVHGTWSLLQCMKSLWISFVCDFLSTFFQSCLNTRVINQVEKTRNIPQPQGKKRSPLKYPESCFHDAGILLNGNKFPHFRNKVKFHKIEGRLVNTLRYKVERLEKQKALVTCSMINYSCPTAEVYERKERGFAIGRIPKGQRLKMDSFTLHQRATECILEQNYISNTRTLEFVTYVKLDASVEDELPTFSLVFSQEIMDRNAEKTAVTVIAAAVSESLRDYLMSRLTSWLACESDK